MGGGGLAGPDGVNILGEAKVSKLIGPVSRRNASAGPASRLYDTRLVLTTSIRLMILRNGGSTMYYIV